jgi:hypothetical protein
MNCAAEPTCHLPVHIVTYPGGEAGQMDMDPEERVCEAIPTVLRNFGELGSARQLLLWTVDKQPSSAGHASRQVGSENPMACARLPHRTGSFATSGIRWGLCLRPDLTTHHRQGRARPGHAKPRSEGSVLLRDHHACYIHWEEFENHQKMLTETLLCKSVPIARRLAAAGRC